MVTQELERDLEVERRKVRDLQEANRESEKEYQKLKVSSDLHRSLSLPLHDTDYFYLQGPTRQDQAQGSTRPEPRRKPPFECR